MSSQKRAWLPPERDYEQVIVRWIGTPQYKGFEND